MARTNRKLLYKLRELSSLGSLAGGQTSYNFGERPKHGRVVKHDPFTNVLDLFDLISHAWVVFWSDQGHRHFMVTIRI